MNEEVRRLLDNIKTLIVAEALDAEFETCASDNMDAIETIEQLNDYFEESMTYWK